MLAVSALSLAARALRELIVSHAQLASRQVLIGPPAAAGKALQSAGGEEALINLFLFRLEPAGAADPGASNVAGWLRVHCLVTAFAHPIAEEDGTVVSAGEAELRLLGHVVQVLNRVPCVTVVGLPGEPPQAQLQLVPLSLSLDDLSHLWSSQSDTPVRLSAGYELAVLPLAAMLSTGQDPVVARVAVQLAGAAEEAAAAPCIAAVAPSGEVVPVLEVDVSSPLSLRVLAAGLPGERLDLTWRRWSRGQGWQPLPALPQQIEVRLSRLPSQVRDTDPALLALSLDGILPGQLLLTARRSARAGGSRPVESSPVLIVVRGVLTP